MSLNRKSLFIFGTIFIVFSIILISIFTFTVSKEDSSVDAVNASGRNRMLSQRISALCLEIVNGKEEAKKSLASAIELHDSTLKVLEFGGVVPSMKTSGELPPVSGSAVEELNKAKDIWGPLKLGAEEVLGNKKLVQANTFIGENYTKLLKANNKLVQALVKYEYPSSVSKKQIKTIIDIAGRNRMLSQRIGLISFKILQGDVGSIGTLKGAIELHKKSLEALTFGGYSDEKKMELPAMPTELMGIVGEINSIWLPYYESANVIANSESAILGLQEITSNYTALLKQNNELVKAISFEAGIAKESEETEFSLMILTLFLLATVLLLVGYILMKNMVIKPINVIGDKVENLSEGMVPMAMDHSEIRDEVGQLTRSVNKLIDNTRSYSQFSEKIGEGQFDFDFQIASEEDELGLSLINMRDQLKNVAEQDKARNWKTQGLAKFSDILRATFNGLEVLSNDIISNLVGYLNAVQGALFIVEEEDGEVIIVRYGSYAYGRQKMVEEYIKPGQGLVGQVYLEKKMTFLKDVPNDYMKITSGLGKAEPRSVVIIPLLVNDEVLGIIELASFEDFNDTQIEFLTAISESIASTIKSAKVNETTKKLLNESKSLEENLKIQEEELRQTMEEMEATQESMRVRERELVNRVAELEARQ